MPSHPTSLRSILILSSIYSWFLQVVLSIMFPHQTSYAPLLSPKRAVCHARLILSHWLGMWHFKYPSVPRYMPALHDLPFSGFITLVCRHSVRFEVRRFDISQSLYLDRTTAQQQRRARAHARFRCPLWSSKP
jgi:hypothetical protein